MQNEFLEQIDMSRFEELSDGDKDNLLELIELYLSKTSEQLHELQKAIEMKAGPDIDRIAHSMIGANAMMGMNTLLPFLKQLETSAEKGQLQEAAPTFDSITQEYKRIQSVLKNKARELS
jgi:HPt (histidine-containing phosphotransfer) domain-containing protein